MCVLYIYMNTLRSKKVSAQIFEAFFDKPVKMFCCFVKCNNFLSAFEKCLSLGQCRNGFVFHTSHVPHRAGNASSQWRCRKWRAKHGRVAKGKWLLIGLSQIFSNVIFPWAPGPLVFTFSCFNDFLRIAKTY